MRREIRISRLPSVLIHQTAFILILAVGIFARTWEYGRLPPDLNPDEASIGVEARDLYRFGEDRNGIAYPVHFIAWGSGQNALYGYVLAPFVGVLGLRPVVVRLPMLISGLLSLPLAFLVGRKSFGTLAGLLAMFMLAISPWHILLSRWGLESNLLPFMFLAGFTCLMSVDRGGGWYLAGCFILGLSMYAYGTAYLAVPVFVLLSGLILVLSGQLAGRTAALGLLAFAFVAIPIVLFILINTFYWPSIGIGPITIPRLPVQPRFEASTLLGGGNSAKMLAQNLRVAAGVLITESDGIAYNVVEPFGIFYRLVLPLGLGGLLAMRSLSNRMQIVAARLIVAWIAAAASIAFLQPVNINRWNLLFMPLLFCAAYAGIWIRSRLHVIFPVAIGALLAAWIAFTVTYHSTAYREVANRKFNQGLLSALQFAGEKVAGPICVTDQTNMPYIYALFSSKTSPAEFLQSVAYVDPSEPLRRVASFGRYHFGTRSCATAAPQAYVLTAAETPPRLGNRYDYQYFDRFVVYYPKE